MNKKTEPMTGLTSGAELYAAMDSLIAKGEEFALIVADIDGLYTTNRDFGREAGDAVILLAAKYLKEIFPEPCLTFRDSRDEFEVLMQGGKEMAFLGAENFRRLVCGVNLGFSSADGAVLKQSISIGVSSYPEDGSRPADIYRRADSACDRAKKNGRNLVCLARDEKLTPKTSHYTQAQLEKLTLISENLAVGEAALLREALDDLLRKYDVDEVMKKKPPIA